MDATLAPSRRFSQAWVFALLVVFFALINIQYFLKVRHSDRPNSQSAFQRWAPQVRELNDGVNIWSKYNWPNPPIMALILKPYMDVDPILLGSQFWLLTKMLCAAASIFLIFAMLDRPEHPFPLWGKLLAVVLFMRPMEGDLVHQNVNLFILMTVVGAVYALHRGWDAAAGLSLALGIACKVTPALFLPYLVWKRAWKTLAATCVGLALFLFVLPSFYFGWSRNLEYLASWSEGMVKPFVVNNEVTSEHQNQSLAGLLERLFRDRPAFTRFDSPDEPPIPVGYHNIANLSSSTVSLIVKGCLGLFCLAVLWRCRAPLDDRTDWRWLAESGAIVLGMLLFSERTWKHHAVTMLIPFAVLAHRISAYRLPRGRWWYLTGTVAAVVVLMSLTATGIFDRQDTIGKLSEVYGAYTWAFFLLLIAMFVLAGQRGEHSVRE